MKKLILLSAFALASCNNNVETKSSGLFIQGHEINITVIDSCEYLNSGISGNGAWVTHKGNCKFCKARK